VFAEKKTEKSDNIVLIDVINNKEIYETDCIEANTHVIVMRTPQKADPIELTYNPKLTGENTLGQQITSILANDTGENGDKAEDDSMAKDKIENNEGKEGSDGGEVIKFQTSKIE